MRLVKKKLPMNALKRLHTFWPIPRWPVPAGRARRRVSGYYMVEIRGGRKDGTQLGVVAARGLPIVACDFYRAGIALSVRKINAPVYSQAEAIYL